MYPQSHFLFPLFIGELLVKFGYVDQLFVLIAVLVGVLIDADHILHHFFIKGELSIIKTADDAFKKHVDDRTLLHHKEGITIVTVILIILSSISLYWTGAFVVGYYGHMLLDHITRNWRFVDNRTYKDYLGNAKPFMFKLFGYSVGVAKYEIVLDCVLVIGVVLLIL